MIRIAALMLAVVAAPAAAQVEAVAERLAEAAPGAVAGLWTPEGAEAAAAGLRAAGGAPMEPGDAVHVGSLTKAMTATLAARLVAAGAIRWDTRTHELLPEAGPPWSDVTLAEWLLHRSGMAANLPRWRAVLRPSRDAYVGHMLRSLPAGERGAFLYSNAGYVVAGAMLEAAGGASWEALLRQEVFAPLGMEGAGFGPPPAARGHRDGRPVEGRRADNIPAMGPAGTVHLPAGAMLGFLAAHATRDPSFLPPAQWERLHAAEGDYAMGWRVEEDGRLAHAGSNTLWFARAAVEEGRAAFTAVNADAPDAVADAIAALLATPRRGRPPG